MEERTSVSNEREERQHEEDTSKYKRGVMQKESPSFPSEIPTRGLLGPAEHAGHTELSSWWLHLRAAQLHKTWL